MAADKEPQPVTITIRDAVAFDGDIKIGDLELTPKLFPVTGFEVKQNVGDYPQVTLFATLHDGWTVDMKAARVRLLELVERVEVHDMRVEPGEGILDVKASGLDDLLSDVMSALASSVPGRSALYDRVEAFRNRHTAKP